MYRFTAATEQIRIQLRIHSDIQVDLDDEGRDNGGNRATADTAKSTLVCQLKPHRIGRKRI